MIQVEIDEQIRFDDAGALTRAAEAALQLGTGQVDVQLTIALEGDERLRQLNRDFLGIDAVTDVLSFPADEFDPDSQARYIGDVIISFPQAALAWRSACRPSARRARPVIPPSMSCNCWWSTACSTCWALTTAKQPKKSPCGAFRRKFLQKLAAILKPCLNKQWATL
jgi:hypothetical protein